MRTLAKNVLRDPRKNIFAKAGKKVTFEEMHISRKHLTYFYTVGLVYLKIIEIMKFYSSEILRKTLQEEKFNPNVFRAILQCFKNDFNDL